MENSLEVTDSISCRIWYTFELSSEKPSPILGVKTINYSMMESYMLDVIMFYAGYGTLPESRTYHMV